MGSVQVTGDYLQKASGLLKIEVESSASFDTVRIAGDATLGGNLVVDLTQAGGVGPGAVIEIMTAASIAPGSEFDDVTTLGSNGERFVPKYQTGDPQSVIASASVLLECHPRGDLNLDGVFDPTPDARALALAFANPERYKVEYGVPGTIMGKVNDDNYFDFDDIQSFRELANLPMAQLLQWIAEASVVPEPTSGCLAWVVCGALAAQRRVWSLPTVMR